MRFSLLYLAILICTASAGVHSHLRNTHALAGQGAKLCTCRDQYQDDDDEDDDDDEEEEEEDQEYEDYISSSGFGNIELEEKPIKTAPMPNQSRQNLKKIDAVLSSSVRQWPAVYPDDRASSERSQPLNHARWSANLPGSLMGDPSSALPGETVDMSAGKPSDHNHLARRGDRPGPLDVSSYKGQLRLMAESRRAQQLRATEQRVEALRTAPTRVMNKVMSCFGRLCPPRKTEKMSSSKSGGSLSLPSSRPGIPPGRVSSDPDIPGPSWRTSGLGRSDSPEIVPARQKGTAPSGSQVGRLYLGARSR